MSKYKYYFRKPKSEITKDILKWLVTSGMIYVAASSPYFVISLMRNSKRWKRYKRKNIYNAFYRLQKNGCINIREKDHQFYVSLTPKGKKKANWLQIDSLEIKRPKKWDKKWRILMFDISELKKFHRELLRGKLKELGFYQLQKSVWLIPFDCRDELGLLKDFFGFSEKEVRMIIAENIGSDSKFKKIFRIES